MNRIMGDNDKNYKDERIPQVASAVPIYLCAGQQGGRDAEQFTGNTIWIEWTMQG